MIITAIFTGKNSLGYESDKEYKLIIAGTTAISICRLDGSGRCFYQSIYAFFKNWDKINTIN